MKYEVLESANKNTDKSLNNGTYKCVSCEIVYKREIAKGIFDFRVNSNELCSLASPGQFAHIKVPGKILRRPISICDVQNDIMRFVFEIKGEGTEILARAKVGDELDMLAPLGKGFKLSKNKKALFVGGGIGVPPLLYASKGFEDSVAIIGFRNKDFVILEDSFIKSGSKTIVTTDDGTYGRHGFVTEPLLEVIDTVDEVYACGPTPMLKAVAKICREHAKSCQVSLEERMGCGVGACLVCACKTKKNGDETYSHVCKDGPVFDAAEVIW